MYIVYTSILCCLIDWLDGWLIDAFHLAVVHIRFCQVVPALTAFQARKSQSVAVVSNNLELRTCTSGKPSETKHQTTHNRTQPSQSSSTNKFCWLLIVKQSSFYWVEPVDVDNSRTWKVEEGTVEDQSESKVKQWRIVKFQISWFQNVSVAFASDHHGLGLHSWCFCQSCGHGGDLSTGAIEDQFVPLAAMDHVSTCQNFNLFGWSKTCFKPRCLQMLRWLIIEYSIKILMNMWISQLHCGHHGLGQTIGHSGSQCRWILKMPRNC